LYNQLESKFTDFKDSLNDEGNKENNTAEEENIAEIIKAIEVLFEMADSWGASQVSPDEIEKSDGGALSKTANTMRP
jgi:hypothetical protein